MNCKDCCKELYCPYIHYFNHDRNLPCVEFIKAGETTTTTNTLGNLKVIKGEENEMGKGLEALNYLEDIAYGRQMNLDPHELKLVIEKELKALEIILTKDIDVGAFRKLVFGRVRLTDKEKLDYWNDIHNNKITMEEFNLVKEILKDK